MKALLIDSFDFCRLNEHRTGEVAVADLHRLASELNDNSGMLKWSLQGGFGSPDHARLTLSVSGSVQLLCQRCLEAFAFKLDSESVLLLAEDEESADEIDTLLADDAIDVIVGSKTLDVIALVEDEALLALPLAPRHSICLEQSPLDSIEKATKDSPFSVLKKLKQ